MVSIWILCVFTWINLHCVVGNEGIRAEKTPIVQKKDKQNSKNADSDCEEDLSSLEESVEEHKQPQTEEIMNAELVARVIILRLYLKPSQVINS